MYSYLVARIKGEGEYTWFKYKGPLVMLPFRGISVGLAAGEVFGVRPSSDGKHIRLVLQGDINRVFTIDLELAHTLAKKCEVIK